uniref:Gastrin releasing peptide receptor-like protein n=1 Tax=Adineta vaga TaxID=104782 RepID=B3G4S6_ADIVA|nr:gastrin releasing peptide receptor-like protein [Adineta vaga]
MDNSTSKSIFDLIRTLAILNEMNKYVYILLYIFGVCGASLNIATFLQKQLRNKPCGVYFLATSIVDLSTINIFILIETIAAFNPSLGDEILLSRIWCKLGNFIRFISPCLSSTYLTLISIDRFCMSSLKQTLRKWSQLRISRIVVVSCFLIWALLALHYPIAYDVRQNPSTMQNQCQVILGSSTIFFIIDGLIFSLFNGAITPLVLATFSLLILFNMKRSRNRVNQQINNGTNRIRLGTTVPTNETVSVHSRHNFHMFRMVLVQITLTSILHIPFLIIYIYTYLNPVLTDLFVIQVYFISAYIARWLYFANYCKTFYVNTLTSQLFRNSLYQQCLNLLSQRHRF